MSPMYSCHDHSGCSFDIEASSPADAAREYVDGGDWAPSLSTYWISVWCRLHPDGETVRVKIQIDPTEPPCCDDGEHDWRYESVRGSGGGVRHTERCPKCGVVLLTDTWAQDPCDGEQGLRSQAYILPDELDEP